MIYFRCTSMQASMRRLRSFGLTSALVGAALAFSILDGLHKSEASDTGRFIKISLGNGTGATHNTFLNSRAFSTFVEPEELRRRWAHSYMWIDLKQNGSNLPWVDPANSYHERKQLAQAIVTVQSTTPAEPQASSEPHPDEAPAAPILGQPPYWECTRRKRRKMALTGSRLKARSARPGSAASNSRRNWSGFSPVRGRAMQQCDLNQSQRPQDQSRKPRPRGMLGPVLN